MKSTTQYGEVKFNSTGDVYHYPLFGVRKVRDAVLKTSSLISPLLGAGSDIYTEMANKQAAVDAYLEEGLDPPNTDVSFLQLSVVVGEQLDNPVVIQLLDLLSEGILKNNLPYDQDSYQGENEFSQYSAVLNESFKRNVLGPLVTSLHQMGFSKILGVVQATMKSYLEAQTPASLKD